ncbi:hypothetical protein [Enterobacter bugandensis]|uniref:hypothetical protein n=1 Tax=Enterobacter bugandensis TaxID=881260 RepID=UPI002FD32E7A
MNVNVSSVVTLIAMTTSCLCHAAEQYIVAECNVETRLCGNSSPVTTLWPKLKGTPFANIINGGFPDFDDNDYTYLLSANKFAQLTFPTKEYELLMDNYYSDAPDILLNGADVVFETMFYRKNKTKDSNASAYVKDDNIVFFSGEWLAPQKLSTAFPVLTGTIFAKHLTAAVAKPGTDANQVYLFSGNQTATLDIKSQKFVDAPEDINKAWKNLWSSARGVHGAIFSGKNNTVYLFTYEPKIPAEPPPGIKPPPGCQDCIPK